MRERKEREEAGLEKSQEGLKGVSPRNQRYDLSGA